MGVALITSLCMNVKIERRRIIVKALFVVKYFHMSLAVICVSANSLDSITASLFVMELVELTNSEYQMIRSK